jgi:hypothetical protein
MKMSFLFGPHDPHDREFDDLAVGNLNMYLEEIENEEIRNGREDSLPFHREGRSNPAAKGCAAIVAMAFLILLLILIAWIL